MKERYFTPESLEQKSIELQRKLAALAHVTRFDPAHSALLVLDMQGYFLDAASHAYIPSAPAIVPSICELIRAYAAHGLPVIYTQHLNTPQNAGSMARWWRELLTAENPLSAIAPVFDLSIGTVIHKSQYDAFYNTSLENLLRQKNVTQLVISGVMTHLCCETTARAAFVRGFDVFFLIDGTATYTEEFHIATLRNLSHGFAVPTLTKDILTAIEVSHAA
jgi:isochorismate hydrolase